MNIKINFQSSSEIGDILATIYSLENYGLQSNNESSLCGNKVVEEIISLFNLLFVKYESKCTNSMKKSMIMKNSHNYTHYICRIQQFLINLGYDPSLTVPLKCEMQREKGENVLVQFDGRFSKRHGFQLPVEEMNEIIQKLAPSEKITLIGGPQTQPYLNNFLCKIGNLKFIRDEILKCKFFLGVDSGISHLAGVLGVESKVIILMPDRYNVTTKSMNNKTIYTVKKYYQCYKNTTTNESTRNRTK